MTELHHKFIGANQHPRSELWLAPFGTAEHGTEASLIFIQTDDSPAVGNIYFSMVGYSFFSSEFAEGTIQSYITSE